MSNNKREKIQEIAKNITRTSSNSEIRSFEFCIWTPVPLNRINEEQAKELKKLCQGADPKEDFRQRGWIKNDQEPVSDPRRTNPVGAKGYYFFEDTLPEFIQELDKIISGSIPVETKKAEEKESVQIQDMASFISDFQALKSRLEYLEKEVVRLNQLASKEENENIEEKVDVQKAQIEVVVIVKH